MIQNFTPRLYQETIFATCIRKDTLVVLPTGLGKTFIFLMLAAQRMKQYPDAKVLFLGPTRPLITQYYMTFQRYFQLSNKKMAVFTGQVKPEKREKLWNEASIIFSTPQGMENDIINKRVDLRDVCLLGFDEAHRAVGNYAYVWIAKQIKKKATHLRILALTASPGSDLETIKEVIDNLYIEEIEVRTDEDPDVKSYIQEMQITWRYVGFPDEFKSIKKFLEDCTKVKLEEIKKYGYTEQTDLSKREQLELQGALQREIAGGNRDFGVMRSISLLAEAMKVQHALELLETQGIAPLHTYLKEIITQARTSRVKAVKNLARDLYFRSALIKTRSLYEANIEHPKLKELKEIITKEIGTSEKIIVFSQYRDTLSNIINELNKIKGVKAEMFVGQKKKKGTGLTQKEQIRMLEDFKDGKFNVIAMSSVGEEGLDIPAVDTVIFYEPIPSAIRTIQRRGRTGRQKKGKVIVLVTKGTRDEAYRWVAHHKQKRMYRLLENFKKKFTFEPQDPTLEKYMDLNLTVYADYREKGSLIIKSLVDQGVNIKLDKLEVGDYLLSGDVAIEYKRVPDFVDSIIDKRALSQIRELTKYNKPLIVLEGEHDLYSQRRIHPNAIRGVLASIALNYRIPIIRTKNAQETTALFLLIAKHEQDDKKAHFTLHTRKPASLKEQQEYLISSLPGVGSILAKPLLREFGSVKNILTASHDDLKKVDLIGDKKAANIRKIIDEMYKE